jgi:hypothetical protein
VQRQQHHEVAADSCWWQQHVRMLSSAIHTGTVIDPQVCNQMQCHMLAALYVERLFVYLLLQWLMAQ